MDNKFFFFRDDGVLKKINLDEILFLESADNYVKFYALEYFRTVRTSLEGALNQIRENRFVQIHRSFAVSLDYIDIIAKDFVVFLSEIKPVLPVSKKYYPALLKRITIIETPAQDAED